MIPPVGVLAGLRRVTLLALAEIPLVIILLVIIPGIAVQPFLPGGFARLQALLKTVNTSVNNVLAATADASPKAAVPAGTRRRRNARP